MQNTGLRKFIISLFTNIRPYLSNSWRKRSLMILSLLSGFYFTNSLISFFLDEYINTIILALLIILIMEITIRSLIFSKKNILSIFLLAINNFRIGSTYALILEAFKLGS